MRISYLAIGLVVAVAACKTDTTAPQVLPTYHVNATITGSNTCAVNALETSYSSVGQIKGDTPSKFVSTEPEKGYHGISCWVSIDGGNTATGDYGFINVIFSGKSYGQPLAVGTYGLKLEILDDTPPMTATIRFRPLSLDGDELRPLDNAVGNIVVDSAANGVRTIHVNLDAVRYHYGF